MGKEIGLLLRGDKGCHCKAAIEYVRKMIERRGIPIKLPQPTKMLCEHKRYEGFVGVMGQIASGYSFKYK